MTEVHHLSATDLDPIATPACYNLAFYKFVKLNNLPQWKTDLKQTCVALDMKGSILVAEEGINVMISGTHAAAEQFLSYLGQFAEFQNLDVKISSSNYLPFNRMLVKIKKEIIPLGIPTLDPVHRTGKRITPEELHRWYEEGKDFVILDTRNDYEVRLGTFENAIDPNIKTFREFPKVFQETFPTPPAKPIVMFCTGGIRCEKATAYAVDQGFQDVYQLDGGILRYFEKFGDSHYNGNCFVFDQRVAVDGKLGETHHHLCFACRAPLSPEEMRSQYYVPEKSCPHCSNRSKTV